MRRHERLRLWLLLGLSLLASSCARGIRDGDGGGGGDPVDPPSDLGIPPFLPGLVSAVGAPTSVRVDWFLPPEALEVAIFLGASAGQVYGGAPVAEDLTGTSLVLTGLPDGTPVFLGLGVRDVGGSAYKPVGLVLTAAPGSPIYVDAGADPQVADGTTPGTAFPALRSGLLTAFAQGGGNVWVLDGDYAEGFLPLLAGVHVFGGFQAGFDLAARDLIDGRTTVLPPAGQRIFDVQGEEPEAVLDGLLLEGGGAATIAVDVNATEIQLRSVEIRDFTDRGLRLRNTTSSNTLDVRLTSCMIQGCGADGASVDGAFDLRVDGSSFDSNVQEGMDLDDLLALDGGVAKLYVTGSRFIGNGAEGLDVDLVAPVFPQTFGGFFDIDIRGCRFELNGGPGLLIDEDYETAPLWNGRVQVRESMMRANGLHGFHMDADARASVTLHRLLASGNAGDGIWVSSETQAGLAVVSASVCAGNRGAGLRVSLGNQAVVAMHDIFTGNAGGGFVSELVESSAASCVARLQGTPWQAVRQVGCVEVDDQFVVTFENVPEAYATVLGWNAETITLDAADLAAPGFVAELADDGTARLIETVAGDMATLDSAPEVLLLPALFAQFPPGAMVAEDYALPLGSPAAGTGMTPPGGPAVDAGPWGSPAGGEPGQPDPFPSPLFSLLGAAPAPSDGLDPLTSITVRFSEDLDPASVAAGQVRAVTSSDVELAVDVRVENGLLIVDPPLGGWGSEPVRLEIHRGLRSLAGIPLSTPTVIPYVPR